MSGAAEVLTPAAVREGITTREVVKSKSSKRRQLHQHHSFHNAIMYQQRVMLQGARSMQVASLSLCVCPRGNARRERN